MTEVYRQQAGGVRHAYGIEVDGHDTHGNPTVEGNFQVHTDQHHDDHGGAHTRSWHDHIHAIAREPMKAAIVASGAVNTATMTIKSVRYLGKEYGPAARRAFGFAFRALRRAAR